MVNMTLNNSTLDKNIKSLIDKGYSGRQIAKELHTRVQTVQQEIRAIKGIGINPKKVQSHGQLGKLIKLDIPSKHFIETLYRQGYPESFVVKLVKVKHPQFSGYKLNQYLQQFKRDNPEIIESHTGIMRFYKGTGRYKQHLDAKWYRETAEHYSEKYQFRRGSPPIVSPEEELLEEELLEEIIPQ